MGREGQGAARGGSGRTAMLEAGETTPGPTGTCGNMLPAPGMEHAPAEGVLEEWQEGLGYWSLSREEARMPDEVRTY